MTTDDAAKAAIRRLRTAITRSAKQHKEWLAFGAAEARHRCGLQLSPYETGLLSMEQPAQPKKRMKASHEA